MKKKFDCVEMKRRIQAKHLVLFKGKSAAEEADIMRERILKDPVLARIWKQSKRVRQQDTAA
jgi:hypothetical protein